MAATPDHGEEFVDTLYNNVIRATSKEMPDSELVVESLGTTTVDQINKYNKVVHDIVAWCSIGLIGSVAVILCTFLLVFNMVHLSFGTLGGLVYILFGILIVGQVETPQVRESVEDKMAPLVKQLQASIMELQKWLTANLVILEGSVAKLQANNGLLSENSNAVRKLISDSELAVKSLERIVDDIDRYNQFVHIGRQLGYGVQIGGGVVAVLAIKGLFIDDITEFFIGICIMGMVCGTSLMMVGMAFIKVFNNELYFETNRIVEHRAVPLLKKLQGSINELKAQWRGVAGVCATLCVNAANQMTQLNYLNSQNMSPTTNTSVKWLANVYHLSWKFVHSKTISTAEQIIEQLLPWLQQQIKYLKNAEQQLNKITTMTSTDQLKCFSC